MIKKFELGDIRRIINMIPQKRSEGIKYIRTEKSGYYSLFSLRVGVMKKMILLT